jgi:hypothetical protein
VVVVNLDDFFAGVGPKDPPDVLDQTALEGDRCGEEHGVERGAVESLPYIRTGSNDQQWPVLGPQLVKRANPLAGAHAPAKYHRLATGCA